MRRWDPNDSNGKGAGITNTTLKRECCMGLTRSALGAGCCVRGWMLQLNGMELASIRVGLHSTCFVGAWRWNPEQCKVHVNVRLAHCQTYLSPPSPPHRPTSHCPPPFLHASTTIILGPPKAPMFPPISQSPPYIITIIVLYPKTHKPLDMFFHQISLHQSVMRCEPFNTISFPHLLIL